MCRTLAAYLILLAAGTLVAQDSVRKVLKPGDELTVLPGAHPVPGMGCGLLSTPTAAVQWEVPDPKEVEKADWNSLGGQGGWFVRAGHRVKLLTAPSAAANVLHVEVLTGAAAGQKGYIRLDCLYPGNPPIQKGAKTADAATTRRVFAVYGKLLDEAFDRAGEVKSRGQWEVEARVHFVRLIDAAAAAEKMSTNDWLDIAYSGIAAGWRLNYRDR